MSSELEEGWGLEVDVLENAFNLFEAALEEAFRSRKDFFISEIVRKLGACDLAVAASAADSDVRDWVGVESLSRLRNIVGGRFQNLKKRWINAGFPLREHRGDKGTDYELQETGWIELSNWIMKQGYEARLSPPDTDSLFELRPLSSQ